MKSMQQLKFKSNQSFEEMNRVIKEFRSQSVTQNQSKLTQKYFNRLHYIAALKGENWVL